MPKLKTKHLLTIALLLLLTQLFTSSFPISVNATAPDDIKVGIYYSSCFVGNWSVNHPDCIDTPALGDYDSSNASVVSQHLNWFNQSGIDFIIFSWWGKTSLTDNK